MIYLLRHGQTLWNREGRLQGQRDSPLTLRGIEQARNSARLLRRLLPDPRAVRVVSSPLGRAWQTAVVVCETLGLDARRIERDARLQEHGFGLWEGATPAEIAARDPQSWELRTRNPWTYRVEGGESPAQVADRIGAWLAEQQEDETVIAVGHGLAGRILRGLYAGLPVAEALALPEEHSSIHHLHNGRIDSFTADPAT